MPKAKSKALKKTNKKVKKQNKKQDINQENKAETSNNNPKQNKTQQNQGKGKKACLIGCIIAAVLGLILVIVLVVFSMFFMSVNKQIDKKTLDIDESAREEGFKEQVQSEPVAKLITYTNSDYGFELELPQSFKDYKIETDDTVTDYSSVLFNVYIPKDKNNAIEFPKDYEMVMTLIAYPNQEWERYKQDFYSGEIPFQLGEELTSNNYYTIVFYPADGGVVAMDQETIDQLNEIKNSAKSLTATKEPVLNNADIEKYLTYKQDSIHYWNCSYNYSLYYPMSWTNNSPTFSSKKAQFQGNSLTATVEAINFNGTLDAFASNRINRYGGNIVNSRDQYKFGTRLIAYQTENPNAAYIFWRENGVFMEFKIAGSGFNSSPEIVENMVATITFNESNPNCSSNQRVQTSNQFNCDLWQHPNGDINYWWDTVSQQERDCYIQKYGYPNFDNFDDEGLDYDDDYYGDYEYDYDGDDFDCDSWQQPNGDVGYWWWEVTEEERQCFIEQNGFHPLR